MSPDKVSFLSDEQATPAGFALRLLAEAEDPSTPAARLGELGATHAWLRPQIMAREAADPGTSPDRLRELGALRSDLLPVVLENPNAPSDLLMLHLRRREFARFVLLNPVFPLLWLDDPSLSRAPRELLRVLAEQPDTPEPLLRIFLDSDDLELKSHLLLNPALPEVSRAQLFRLHREAMVRCGFLPREFHHTVLSDGVARVRREAASRYRSCEHCRPFRNLLARAERLASGRHEPRLSDSEQSTLLGAGERARVLLTRQPSLRDDTLRALAGDPCAAVRRVLASSSLLDDATADRLADDEDEAVVRQLAARPRLSEALARKLAGARWEQVRRALARHPALPLGALEALERDPRMVAELRARASDGGAARRGAQPWSLARLSSC